MVYRMVQSKQQAVNETSGILHSVSKVPEVAVTDDSGEAKSQGLEPESVTISSDNSELFVIDFGLDVGEFGTVRMEIKGGWRRLLRRINTD